MTVLMDKQIGLWLVLFSQRCTILPTVWTQTLTGEWKCVTQLCLPLCDPIDCSLPGSSVHGILQAIILEWVASPFSSGSSQPRDWTCVSPALQANTLLSEPPGKPKPSWVLLKSRYVPWQSLKKFAFLKFSVNGPCQITPNTVFNTCLE